MVFNKNVDNKQIEEFEIMVYNKVSHSPQFLFLKNALNSKKLNFKMEVQHTDRELKTYSSQLVIDIFDENGEWVCEKDEPGCCLMLCEIICYKCRGHVVGVDLITDKEFLESLENLIKGVEAI